jgi:hypothetical protein
MKPKENFRLVAVAIVLALTLGPVSTNAIAQQGPPINVDDSFPIEGICPFPVLVELSGKAKTIQLPGGGLLFTSPKLTATFTNLNQTSNGQTVGITGSIRETMLANGEVELEFTGRNLLIGFDPVAGFVITVGRFSASLDADGNLIQPLSGDGRFIDVCELLE